MFDETVAAEGEFHHFAQSQGSAGDPEVDFYLESSEGGEGVVDYAW